MSTTLVENHVELEIRIEARFVLWALRWCAHRSEGATEAAAREVMRGFELADATETLDRFWRFAQALCDVIDGPAAWHHPTCECVSREELQVLEALSRSALLDAASAPQPACPWDDFVSRDHALLIDVLARQWLHALRGAGICYPLPGELVREGHSQSYAGLPVPPQRH